MHDNSIVTIASNCETHIPHHKVNRRVKGGNKEVTQPHHINSFNKGIGGVDLMDRLLETYRPVFRVKKWYWPLFINLLNVSVVAAWRIHCILEKANKLSHLEFRRYICSLLAKSRSAKRKKPWKLCWVTCRCTF